ncbi:MAG TPA: hypothetical protein VN328_05920 [Thermodesulfovibrionales bacterium]|nr:hypothetical protein [Thermodesulfovibrionales bacterium]
MGVPVTSDPGEKLAWANNLHEKQNRPLPAERLIQEARDIYQGKNDELGLAEAYRQYAIFLVSATVGRWESHYRKNSFMDKSITFDSRHEKGLEYLQKSKELYAKNGKYDALSNIDIIMGNVYLTYLGNQNKACQHYDQSLLDHQEFRKQNPNAKIYLPDGFKSYDELVGAIKKEAKCM